MGGKKWFLQVLRGSESPALPSLGRLMPAVFLSIRALTLVPREGNGCSVFAGTSLANDLITEFLGGQFDT